MSKLLIKLEIECDIGEEFEPEDRGCSSDYLAEVVSSTIAQNTVKGTNKNRNPVLKSLTSECISKKKYV